MAARRRKASRRHWYRMHVGECPLCGSDKGYRERVYGKRPKRLSSRHVLIPQNLTYDHCMGF